MSELKQNDNALINMIADFGDITIDKRRRWSIEFDDYGIQGVINALRQHFIEQACAAITDNPHKNPIEAITDMVRKETD